jgi:energy-coupling factor transporter ATP-binding protein EcfA2
MERLDAAKSIFDKIHRFATENAAQIVTEADARLHLIDRILIEVLGWRREGIQTEPHSNAGYLDYLLSSGGRNVFVVEAKRVSHELISTKLPDYRFYKVGGAALRDAQEGIDQAVSYCSSKSVPFSALTNGLAWVGFRPIRIDGVECKNGAAAVFPNLEAIKKNFAEFYDLFSQEGVSQKLYSVYLDREEGSALSAVDPLDSLIPPSDIYLMKKTDLARDLDQLFDEFFKTLTGETDEELLLHCFVESPESREADRSLSKITRNLLSHVQSIRSDTGIELRKEIETSFETKKGQIVLIVGNKGAGKSTFVDRFFRFVLPRELREKCLILKIDVALASGNLGRLQEWLTDGLIKAAENSLYSGKTPAYDDLLGIFFDHYQRWSTGEHKHLYDTDIDAFKIKFGEYIANRRQEKPEEYLNSVLKRAIRQRTIVPCIVFDNADNFPAEIQDAVFQYAYSLFRAVALSIVVVPITDRTIWRLSKAGALQSYSAKTFYLPVPSTKNVLEKRVQFIRRKLDEGVDKSVQYFSSKGLRIKMENMPAFAACVEEAFINTDYIARRIGSLTNYDLRRSLELSQKIITAPVLKVDDLVAAYFSKRRVIISEMRIVQALLFGEYNKFRQDAHEYVLNLFSLENSSLNSPLLRVRVLRLFMDKQNASKEFSDSYLPYEEVERYFESMGVAARLLFAAIKELLDYRLLEPYEPNAEQVTPTTRIAITNSGQMHFEMAFNDPVYLEQMAQTTAVRSEKLIRALFDITSRKMGFHEWMLIKRKFAKYILDEDELLISCPAHQAYNSQRKIREEFTRWLH